MTKQNIVDAVSDATGLTKVETEAVMNGVMTTIIEALATNNRVELRGFGTFGVKHRMPKKARNPGTGEPIYLPERFVPTFKPSKMMRLRGNELINKYRGPYALWEKAKKTENEHAQAEKATARQPS